MLVDGHHASHPIVLALRPRAAFHPCLSRRMPAVRGLRQVRLRLRPYSLVHSVRSEPQ